MGRKPIYQILKENTTDGILDIRKADDALHPAKEDGIRISAGFLEHMKGNTENGESVIPTIMEIIGQIYRGESDAGRAREHLEQLEFNTADLIDGLIDRISEKNYNETVYEAFREILYQTIDAEVFKLSMEMTARMRKCRELLDDYFMAGQYEEFSVYTAYILNLWMEQDTDFLKTAFRLLAVSSDWGAIDYGERLMGENWILEKIENQRDILIGTLSNNCIPMEVCFSLASTLNVGELLKAAKEDKELSESLLELFYTLFFEPAPCGGLLDLERPFDGYLAPFLKFLDESVYPDITFFGMLTVSEFLDDEQYRGELLNSCTSEEYEAAYERARICVEECSDPGRLKSIVCSMSEGHSAQLIGYIEKNEITYVDEEIEQRYVRQKECTVANLFFETYLARHGSRELKKRFYTEICETAKSRAAQKRPQSYRQIFGDEYQSTQKFEYKLGVLTDCAFRDDALLVCFLEDYNPQIRAAALEVAGRQNAYFDNPKVRQALLARLGDSPYYVRFAAAELFAKQKILLSQAERKQIDREILAKEPDYKEKEQNYPEYYQLLNELMSDR